MKNLVCKKLILTQHREVSELSSYALNAHSSSEIPNAFSWRPKASTVDSGLGAIADRTPSDDMDVRDCVSGLGTDGFGDLRVGIFRLRLDLPARSPIPGSL